MNRPDNESSRLPRFPSAFWSLGDRVLESWRGLLLLLDEEWKALEKVDLTSLWRLSEAKNRQAEEIAAQEKRLNTIIDNILSKCGSTPGANRWSTILLMLQHGDASRLQTWMAEVKRLRFEVKEINRRHINWLNNQLKLVDQLTDILMGRTRETAPVYSPQGRLGKPDRMIYQRREVA